MKSEIKKLAFPLLGLLLVLGILIVLLSQSIWAVSENDYEHECEEDYSQMLIQSMSASVTDQHKCNSISSSHVLKGHASTDTGYARSSASVAYMK